MIRKMSLHTWPDPATVREATREVLLAYPTAQENYQLLATTRRVMYVI